MVPRPQFPRGQQRGPLLRLWTPGGHCHAMHACGGQGCPTTPSTQAGLLPPTSSSCASRAWPPWGARLLGVIPRTGRAWGAEWEHSRKGCQYACGEKAVFTGQVGKPATFLAKPVNAWRIPLIRTQHAASCVRTAPASTSSEGGRRESQNVLRSTRRWDSVQAKGDFRLLDSWSKESVEPSWPVNHHKPARLDAIAVTTRHKPARLDHTAFDPSPWSFFPDPADQLSGPGVEKQLTPDSVKKLCQQGQVRAGVEVLEVLVGNNSGIDKYLFYSVLKECVVAKDLMLGAQVHALAVRMGYGSDTFLCNNFIRMYAGHGMLQEAMNVFRGVPVPDAFMWSSIISAHARQGQAGLAIQLYQQMRATSIKANGHVLVAALQACAAAGDLHSGKQVHNDAFTSEMMHNMFVSNCLVDMYAKCGSLKDARKVFDGLAEKDVVTWNAMMAGYAKAEGMGQEALSLYGAMQRQGMVSPDEVTFACLLQACASVGVSALETGKHLHSQLKQRKLEPHVGCSLVNMYVRCGSLEDARMVFDGLSVKNVVTWTAMISGYAQQKGMGQEALNLYRAMQNEGLVAPNAVTFVCLLRACANVGVSAIETGKQLHSQLKGRSLQLDVVTGSSLVNMYVKCGSLDDARIVFDGLVQKNVVTWNAMISGYAQLEGMGQEALTLYSAMCNEGQIIPDAVTYVCLLQACANMGVSATEAGKQLHSHLKARGLDSNVVLGGSLVNMYAKCGSLKDARTVFDGLSEKNVVTWTTMIAAYGQQEGMGQEVLNLCSAMHTQGLVVPNAVTFACLLQACANVGGPALDMGKQLHAQLQERCLESNVVVGGSLVNMYVKCGSLEDARVVFDGLSEKNVVTWTAMIAGYAQQEGMGHEALDLYSAMRTEGLAAPNAVTFACLLQACANVGASALETGKQLHLQVKDRRCESDVVVGSSLVNMYVKCGSLQDARAVFDGLAKKNVVTWTALIAGYAQQEGMGQEALNLYSAMLNEGMAAPDAVTYACLLEACASVGALHQGKKLHSEIREKGIESNVLIATGLVKMFAKCGCLKLSRQVFDRLPVKNLVTWTALLKAYAEHGEGAMAIQCFQELLEHGILPNDVTYTCLFTACSHAGLVDEAQQYFESMVQRHGVEPTDRHYNCMVDLLGRSGHLEKAERMLLASKVGAGDAVSWTALLSACKSHGNAELGKRCFDHLVKLDPTVATPYMLLGSIYANAGKWADADRLESMRKAAGLRKVPGKACIEVKKEVHEFTVGEDRSDVFDTLKKMNKRVKEGGHVPQTQLVLRAASEQEKEDVLCGHAEKLALAYGLLHTPAGSTLVVTKNLRMCNDCHSSTKIMSRLEKREIVVRDGHKVHRFHDGACSCKDRP